MESSGQDEEKFKVNFVFFRVGGFTSPLSVVGEDLVEFLVEFVQEIVIFQDVVIRMTLDSLVQICNDIFLFKLAVIDWVQRVIL